MLDLTVKERQVIIFLFAALLAGVGISYYQKVANPGDAMVISSFKERIKTEPLVVRDKININVATKEQLMSMPGISQALAERILEYRSQYGPLSDTVEIKKVKGIGEKKFNNLKGFLTIEGGPQ